MTRSWPGLVSDSDTSCHQAYVPGEYGHSQRRCRLIAADGGQARERVRDPLRPAGGAAGRDPQAGSVRPASVARRPAPTTRKPSRRSSSRNAGSTRPAAVIMIVSVPVASGCPGDRRERLGLAVDEHRTAGEGHGGGQLGPGRGPAADDEAVGQPGLGRRAAGHALMRLQRVQQVEDVTDSTDAAQPGRVEVQLPADLVLDPQGQLGEVQRPEPDRRANRSTRPPERCARGPHVRHQLAQLITAIRSSFPVAFRSRSSTDLICSRSRLTLLRGPAEA